MYGENQRLSEGIPCTTKLINIAAFILVYSVGSFFPAPCAEDSFIDIYFFKPEMVYQF